MSWLEYCTWEYETWTLLIEIRHASSQYDVENLFTVMYHNIANSCTIFSALNNILKFQVLQYKGIPIKKLSRVNYNLDEPLDSAESTNSLLKILPAGFFGIALMKATRRIFLYGATYENKTHSIFKYLKFQNRNVDMHIHIHTCFATKSITSSALILLPGFLTTNAIGICPASSSGYLPHKISAGFAKFLS